uniref:Uncharacterized protein n=1 Tax=Panagrolaimus davidi TaxID=227884 RepID=A0A914PGF1_9BILA
MKFFFFAPIFWLCLIQIIGAVFEPYNQRYFYRSVTFENLFPTRASTAIQNLVNSAQVIDNDRCKDVYKRLEGQSNAWSLNSFHYDLVVLCPKLYDSIRYLNITTWGPVEEFIQIWSMKYVGPLWMKIVTKSKGSSRCLLYDQFERGFLDFFEYNNLNTSTSKLTEEERVTLEYLDNNYDPSLCIVNADTMYKWYQFLQTPLIKNWSTKSIDIAWDFSIQVLQYLVKAYLTEARYNSYFEPPIPTSEYPLLTYYDAALLSANFSITQKGFIKQVRNYYKLQFPSLNLEGRQQLLLKRFSADIDLSYSYFAVFNRIPLDPSDGITHYDLILYLSRKDDLLRFYNQLPITTTTITTTPTSTTTCTTVRNDPSK